METDIKTLKTLVVVLLISVLILSGIVLYDERELNKIKIIREVEKVLNQNCLPKK